MPKKKERRREKGLILILNYTHTHTHTHTDTKGKRIYNTRVIQRECFDPILPFIRQYLSLSPVLPSLSFLLCANSCRVFAINYRLVKSSVLLTMRDAALHTGTRQNIGTFRVIRAYA